MITQDYSNQHVAATMMAIAAQAAHSLTITFTKKK